MLLRVSLIIFIGFSTINAKAEQHTTTTISSEENNSSQSNVTTSKESADHQNSDRPNITTTVSKNVDINTSESSHEKSLKNTRRSESVVDIPDFNLKQETDSDKDIDEKSKDSDHLDSNISLIVTTKSSILETDDTINFRRLNLTDSKIKDSNLNDTYNDSQHANTTDKEMRKESKNDSESQVVSRNLTDNGHELYDDEENHNETEAKISRNADNNNTNTKASKESIVYDVNDGTNNNDTTKRSIHHLEPNSEDNVHKLYDNEESHNETEAKISRNADNNNTNTKASKESIVYDVNDGTNNNDTTKRSIHHLEPNTEDNVHKLYDDEENLNETEAKISRNADNNNTNTKASKESIVYDVNDGTNNNDTTKRSIHHLEPNTEDNVHKLYDNEENHNEAEAKISRNTDNYNIDTEAAKESIVNHVNDGTNKNHTTNLSIRHLEPNTEDNVHKLYDNEENNNETEAQISRSADYHNINTEAAKESIVNGVKDGTNETLTTELSIRHLEPNTEENVHKLYDNEENHNKTEAQISRNADNHNTNTEAVKKSVINDGKDGTNEKHTTKRDGNIHDYDSKQIDDTQSKLLSNITEIDNEESTEHNKGGHTISSVFSRRSFDYKYDKKFTEIYATTTDEPVITDHPITTKLNNNNYDLFGRNGYMRRNLNYDAVSNESTEKSSKPDDTEENNYPLDTTQINVNQRNKINDITIKDAVKPIEEANDSEDIGNAMSRSGMPGGGYISKPYYEDPNLIKPPMVTTTKPPQILNICCQPKPSSPNYGTSNSFIVHPIYGKISPLFNPLNVLGKSIEINPKSLHNEHEHIHHYLVPNIKIPLLKRLYDNHANPGIYEDHGINILNHENNGNVFANRNNPLTSHGNPFSNHESPLGYNENPLTSQKNPHLYYGNPLRSSNPSATYENLLTDYLNPQSNHENPLLRHDRLPNYENSIHGNNNAKYLPNQPDYDASYNNFQRHARPRRRDEYIDDNIYPRAVGTQESQAILENLSTNHGNLYSNYENPLIDHGPLTNHENPLANHNLITRRVYPLNDNQNDVIKIHGNPTNQHDDAPFYNNFRHHETGSEEIDTDRKATGEVNPVTSSQAKYVIASQRFPVMAVPFRKFFL